MLFIISVVITLILVSVLLWLVNQYAPMDAKMKKALNIAVGIAAIGWLLYAFGVFGHAGANPVLSLN